MDRYLTFFGVALLVARRRGLRATLRSHRPVFQVGRSLVLVAEQAAFIIAFIYLPLSNVHAIAAVSPLVVTVLSATFLGEHVGLRHLLAVAAGFTGVLVIVRPGMGVMSKAALIPLVAALLFAVYQMMTRVANQSDRTDTSLLYSGLTGAILMSLLGPLNWQWPTWDDWMLLLLVSALGCSAHFAIIKALDATAASAVQPFTYTLFLWAIFVGYIGFSHLPDTWTLIGATVIIASNLYVFRHNSVLVLVKVILGSQRPERVTGDEQLIRGDSQFVVTHDQGRKVE